MYAFAVCEPRVVTVVSCVLKVSYFIHRDFTPSKCYVLNAVLALFCFYIQSSKTY